MFDTMSEGTADFHKEILYISTILQVENYKEHYFTELINNNI